MIHRQRSGKFILLLAMVFALYTGGSLSLCAEQNEASTKTENATGEKEYLYNDGDPVPLNKTLSLTSAPGAPAPTLFGVISKIFVVLFLMTAVAVVVIRYVKNGTINFNKLKPIGIDNRLMILETKMLGGRQYLTVVEYNEQKMLLAVSPGRVEQLCFLESVYEEESREAEFELNRDPS